VPPCHRQPGRPARHRGSCEPRGVARWRRRMWNVCVRVYVCAPQLSPSCFARLTRLRLRICVTMRDRLRVGDSTRMCSSSAAKGRASTCGSDRHVRLARLASRLGSACGALVTLAQERAHDWSRLELHSYHNPTLGCLSAAALRCSVVRARDDRRVGSPHTLSLKNCSKNRFNSYARTHAQTR
jgi:hypothetical protein